MQTTWLTGLEWKDEYYVDEEANERVQKDAKAQPKIKTHQDQVIAISGISDF